MAILPVRAFSVSDLEEGEETPLSYLIESPISIKISTRKEFSMNLNIYRNAHHRVLDSAKKNYTSLMVPQLKVLPKLEKVFLRYTLYKGSHHMLDVSNVCSIVDKFFSDALVKAGIIEDDNHSIVKGVEYCYGGYSKENPRVDIQILPLKD